MANEISGTVKLYAITPAASPAATTAAAPAAVPILSGARAVAEGLFASGLLATGDDDLLG